MARPRVALRPGQSTAFAWRHLFTLDGGPRLLTVALQDDEFGRAGEFLRSVLGLDLDKLAFL